MDLNRSWSPDSDAVLRDAESACCYRDLPDLLDRMERAFRSAGASDRDVVALDGRNTLPSALAILAGVRARQNVFLVPAADARPGQARLPPLCRFLAGASSSGLELEPNPAWNGFDPGDGGRLYLPTSGSTGRSKIVVHRYDRLLGNAGNCVERFALSPDDRVVIPVPIGHMYGLGAAFLPAVLAGAAVDLQADANIVRFLADEQKFEPTVAFLAPSFLEGLARLWRSERRFRLTVTAGDKLAPKAFVRFENRCGPLVNLYGSSEMGAVASSVLDDPLEVRCRTLGALLPGVSTCPDHAAVNREAGPFELCIRHPFGFLGYVSEDGGAWDDPFDADGCFRTRDLVHSTDDGRLEYRGRIDDCVNRDGILVALSEIERAMERNPLIEAAVIVSTGRNVRGSELTAYCVITEAVSADELRKQARGAMPLRFVPDRVVIRESLPRLPSGKYDRRRLAELAAGAAQQPAEE